jgi:mannose-6-phosphate isomerase-like protein (cupin superfamily)
LAIAGTLDPSAAAWAQTKNGAIVKKISYTKDSWKYMGGVNADLIWWPKGGELGGRKVNFSFGYYSRMGAWNTKQTGGHYHPDGDEVLMFLGFDPDRPDYLGAEVEFDTGTEYEEQKFKTPTACCFPTNLNHCPTFTTRCESTYGFVVLQLEPNHTTIAAPERSVLDNTHGHKYDRLYKQFVFRKDIKAKTGPGNADALAWLKGADMENFEVNFAWGFFSGTGDWGAKAHKHASDQFLVFVSLDKENPYNIGAEMEVTLDGEKYQIREPTCVIIPEGVEHGPIVTKKVDRTYGFYSIRLDKGDPSEFNPA